MKRIRRNISLVLALTMILQVIMPIVVLADNSVQDNSTKVLEELKLAIGVCEKINGRCSTKGCFTAYNKKDKHFSKYKDSNVELQAFFYM